MALYLQSSFINCKPLSRLIVNVKKTQFKTRNISKTFYRKCQAKTNVEGDDKKVIEYKSNVLKIKKVTHNERVANSLQLMPKESPVNSIINRPMVEADDALVQEFLHGIKKQQRSYLARGITLVESSHPLKRAQGQMLVREVLLLNKDIHGHSLNNINTFRIGLEFF